MNENYARVYAWDVCIPFSVRSLLKESVLDRPGSEMTFDPSLTVRSMERYPWGSLRSYSSVSSWAKVISGGNGWPGEKTISTRVY